MTTKNNRDLQSEPDLRRVAIDRVGVKGVRYPLVLSDKSQKVQHTVAELDIYVSLPHNLRGTHMSRFLEVLNRFHSESLVDSLDDFLQQIKKALSANAAYANLRFPYFIRKKAPVSGIAAPLAYDCCFEASLEDDFRMVMGVTVPVTSLCPCSREISDRGAHNQRSLVTARIRYNKFVWLEELIAWVEACGSAPVYALLKRPDEKYVTEQAYDNPRFVEDMVRELALTLEAQDRVDEYRVQAENFESIHAHSAYATLHRDKTL